jgi:hypothetical protein
MQAPCKVLISFAMEGAMVYRDIPVSFDGRKCVTSPETFGELFLAIQVFEFDDTSVASGFCSGLDVFPGP